MYNKIAGKNNGKVVEYSDLRKISVPTATRSYQPIQYNELIDMVIDKSRNTLSSSFTEDSTEYVVARDNQHFFGLHTYKENETGLRLAIGFRNSYNKQLSVGLACGSQVVVCTNLMITGDVFVMRKNTTNAVYDLDSLIVNALKTATDSYAVAMDRKLNSGTKYISNEYAYKFLGLITGKGILKHRQFAKAIKEFHNPSYNHGDSNTAWMLYNAVTESMKSNPIHSRLSLLSKFDRMYDQEMQKLFY